MSDARSDADAGQQSGVSEEQAREQMEQLRAAPPEQVVAELLSSVLSTAQAKLGRNDARLLIDMAGAMVQQARPQLSAELREEAERALSQLQLAQVEAESASDRQPESGDLSSASSAAGETTAAQTEAPAAGRAGDTSTSGSSGRQAGGSSGSSTSGLWLPGRDF